MAETWRERNHRATREEILAVARGLMLEEGIDGLGIREIARRTGFGPASLYTYFAGKDEIVAAITDESLGELDEYLERVSDELPAGERLVALGLAYLRFADENPADFACIVEVGLRGGLPERTASLGTLGPVARIAATLRHGREAGDVSGFDEDAIDEAAFGLWAQVHGMAVLRHAGFDRESPAVTEGIVRRAVAAIGAASSS